MKDSPAVLLLVKNVEEREVIRRRLIEMEVLPIVVRADRASAAIDQYHPIAALMDEPHAAMAPDDFLELTCTNHIRLVTLPDREFCGLTPDSLLEWAIAPQPAF